MQATTHATIQLLHAQESLPIQTRRKLKVLRHVYLNPSISFTQIKESLGTRSDKSVRPVVDDLLEGGLITSTKRPFWNVHIHVWRVIDVFKITKKGESVLIEQVEQ